MRIFPLLLVASFVLATGTVLAQTTDGTMATTLTIGMYCDLKGIFSGKIGLLVGFVIALMGLMKLIQGNTSTGILFILAGAAVSWAPALIETFLNGVGSAVSGFSERPQLDKPDC